MRMVVPNYKVAVSKIIQSYRQYIWNQHTSSAYMYFPVLGKRRPVTDI